MNDKERFDALMALAKFRDDIRGRRIAHEWRLSFGLWAAMAGSIIYLKGRPTWLLVTLWLIVVFVHMWFWIRTNFNSNERDALLAYYHAECAERLILGDTAPDPGQRPRLTKKDRMFGFLRQEHLWFSPLVTIILGLAVITISSGLLLP